MTPEFETPNWNRCPGPTVCFALTHASEASKDALIVYQAQQIDRLTGGRYEQPTPERLAAVAPDEPAVSPSPGLLELLEAVLWREDVLRKPPRVAAPKILAALSEAGYLTEKDPAA